MAVRYGLPAGVALAGLVLTTAGTSNDFAGAGVALVGVGMLVALLNLLMRLGPSRAVGVPDSRQDTPAAREHGAGPVLFGDDASGLSPARSSA